MISFSTFLLGNLKVNDNFGMLTMIIMFLALACDLIVLPAVLFQFDKFKKRSASKA
jgi:predicted RND superfamily exporter protein